MSKSLRAAAVFIGAVGVVALAATPASAATIDGVHVIAAFNPIEWLVGKIYEGLGWLLAATLSLVLSTSEPNVGYAWFKDQYRLMVGIGSLMTIPVAMIATITAVAKGGLRLVLRTYLIGFPVAILGSTAAIAMIALAQAIDVNLTNAVTEVATTNYKQYYDSIIVVDLDALDLGALLAGAVVSLFMIIGLIFLWMEMFLRQLVIYLSVLFLPFGFAMFTWSGTRRWLTSLIELILTAIFAKFVIIAILGFGFSAVFNGGTLNNVSSDSWEWVGMLTFGGLVIFLACIAMPALITWVMGPGVALASRKEVVAKTPLSVGTGRTAARQAIGRIGKGK